MKTQVCAGYKKLASALRTHIVSEQKDRKGILCKWKLKKNKVVLFKVGEHLFNTYNLESFSVLINKCLQINKHLLKINLFNNKNV